MVKSSKHIEKKQEFEKFAREEIKEKPDISANLIIEKAQKKGIGIRRKDALKIIRQIKGKRKKPHSKKYIPKKYRRKIIVDYYPFYFGKLKFEFFDQFGEWNEGWITTKLRKTKKEVYSEMWYYEQRIMYDYKIDVQRFLEVIYGMYGKKYGKPEILEKNTYIPKS
ncbi:MAG: hypothetical protein QXO65_03415 [Candidatus Aenigmatarchaeota archaeon]